MRKVQAAVNMLPEAVSFDEGNLTVSLSVGYPVRCPQPATAQQPMPDRKIRTK